MKVFSFLISIFLLILFFTNCSKKQDHPVAGLWHLYTMEVKDTISNKWTFYKGGMDGYLLYDDTNNMSLFLCTDDYKKTNLKISNFSDTISIEKLKYLTNAYFYIGKYKIDYKENIVNHTRIAHSNPNDWDVTVKRKFNFKNDTLLITPVEKENASLRLKWLRAGQNYN